MTLHKSDNLSYSPKGGDVVVCVVGVGYVGLPLACAFSKKYTVYAYDIDEKRIEELKKGVDRTGEVTAGSFSSDLLTFTTNPEVISRCKLIIVTVPTPVTDSKEPDLRLVTAATKMVGRYLSKGSIIVFESTVYPGVTEGICVPLLERESKLKFGLDFKVGYSPERINPGDKKHAVDKVVKVVSASDEEALEIISKMYSSVIQAGVFCAPSIKVAEAAKVIENIQRDINIALMNELKIIFDRAGIDTDEVLKTAQSKWNFLPFYPGLVGGHCIGVDPYYLAYKAKTMGIHPEIILAGRRVNDRMAFYHAGEIVKGMAKKGIRINGAKVLVLGATFKPGVRDLRNSKVADLVNELKAYGCDVVLCEPNLPERKEIFGCQNIPLRGDGQEECTFDLVVRAVPHKQLNKVKADYEI